MGTGRVGGQADGSFVECCGNLRRRLSSCHCHCGDDVGCLDSGDGNSCRNVGE